MKTFNEQHQSYNPNETVVYSINELIEKLDRLTPNFSEIFTDRILPEEMNKMILEARSHYDKAIDILKKVAFTKDEQGNYLGDKEFNKPAS